MGQNLHGGATTTEAVRRVIQASAGERQDPGRALSYLPRHGPDVAQAGRHGGHGRGPKALRSTVPSPEDEAVVMAFRRQTLLPLDDGFYALQSSLPHLTRSSLRRCLQSHGNARLPEADGTEPKRPG